MDAHTKKETGKSTVPLVSSELPAVHSVRLAAWQGDSDLKTKLHPMWDFPFRHLLQLSVSSNCGDRFACIKTTPEKLGRLNCLIFLLYVER